MFIFDIKWNHQWQCGGGGAENWAAPYSIFSWLTYFCCCSYIRSSLGEVRLSMPSQFKSTNEPFLTISVLTRLANSAAVSFSFFLWNIKALYMSQKNTFIVKKFCNNLVKIKTFFDRLIQLKQSLANWSIYNIK